MIRDDNYMFYFREWQDEVDQHPADRHTFRESTVHATTAADIYQI